MKHRQTLDKLFRDYGYDDFKWIDPKTIVVSRWVRMKCLFGCPGYGQSPVCPPNTPSVSECERFFREYAEAVVFHFAKTLEKPEDRHAWSRQVNRELLKLEREVFLRGYNKAFLLFMDTCDYCAECVGAREQCRDPKSSRPAPEALAMDVFETVRQHGYPITVLSDYSQEMNRYAFLLIQ